MLFKMMNTKNTVGKQYLEITAFTVEQLLNIFQRIRVKVVVQWGKPFTVNPHNLSSIPRNHLMETERVNCQILL